MSVLNSGRRYSVRLGSHYKIENLAAVAVDRIIMHPDYKPGEKNQHDIALLHLAAPVKYWNDTIQPACLPTRGPEVGETCVVTGWGGKLYHRNAHGYVISVIQKQRVYVTIEQSLLITQSK